MLIEEYEPEKEWWNNREENEFAWKVSIDDIKANNYNLDIKNPHVQDIDHGDPEELLEDYKALLSEIEDIRNTLKAELMTALEGKRA